MCNIWINSRKREHIYQLQFSRTQDLFIEAKFKKKFGFGKRFQEIIRVYICTPLFGNNLKDTWSVSVNIFITFSLYN